MTFRSDVLPKGEGRVFGFFISTEPGYKKVFCGYLWFWGFEIEFGKGDGYDYW